MFDILNHFAQRPGVYSVYTTPEFWSDPHVGQSMLSYHLDEKQELASRRIETIEASVDHIDQVLTLSGKTICDLGCGPGLYTERFHDRGAKTIGVDVSPVTLHHARGQAERTGREIEYIKADYTKLEFSDQYDIMTMIYCDYCVLSPGQRAALLAKVKSALPSGGYFVFDVFSLAAFEGFEEGDVIEPNLMAGFWSANDYVGLKRSIKYLEDQVSLDLYLIVEKNRNWLVYNWLQYFSVETLTAELSDAGFVVDRIDGDLTGAALNDASPTLAVFARAN